MYDVCGICVKCLSVAVSSDLASNLTGHIQDGKEKSEKEK